MNRDEHVKLLRVSGAKVDELQAELQNIRDQEAALQAQRVEKLDALKTARQERFKVITSAIADKVPKALIARELGIDRTTLYKMMEGKDDSTEA